jgi:MFS superfamily sulfate permease-like transporter
LQTSIAAPAPAFAGLRREIIAGVTVACITPPMCIAAGVLVYSPLGSAYIPQGAAAGLYGAVFAGLVAALVASSSFIVTAPAASVCILLAALVSSLAHDPAFAAHPHWIVLAPRSVRFSPACCRHFSASSISGASSNSRPTRCRQASPTALPCC